MSYRLTEAERKHILTLEDTNLYLELDPNDSNRIILHYTDDETEKSCYHMKLPKYVFWYDKATAQIAMKDDLFQTSPIPIDVGYRYKISGVFDSDDYLKGFDLYDLNKYHVKFTDGTISPADADIYIDLQKLSDMRIKELFVDNNAEITKNLTVNGDTTLNDSLTVNGITQITGETSITGDTQITGDTTVTGDFVNENGDAYFRQNVDIIGTLNVNDETFLNDNVNITNGNVTINNGKLDAENADFSNEVNIAGELNVSDQAKFFSGLVVKNSSQDTELIINDTGLKVTTLQAVQINGDTTISGNLLKIESNLYSVKNVNISGNTSFTGEFKAESENQESVINIDDNEIALQTTGDITISGEVNVISGADIKVEGDEIAIYGNNIYSRGRFEASGALLVDDEDISANTKGYFSVTATGIEAHYSGTVSDENSYLSLQKDIQLSSKNNIDINAENNIYLDAQNISISGNATVSGKLEINYSAGYILSDDEVITQKLFNNQATTLNDKIDSVSGDWFSTSGTVDTISGNLDSVSGNLLTVSGIVDDLVTDLYTQEIDASNTELKIVTGPGTFRILAIDNTYFEITPNGNKFELTFKSEYKEVLDNLKDFMATVNTANNGLITIDENKELSIAAQATP